MSETKWTKGPWKFGTDAQGPCMVMHPRLKGVAIASLSDVFRPTKGFHDPTVRKPQPCSLADSGKTYRPERVANAHLIAAAPELYEALQEMMEMYNAPENLDAPQRVAIWSRAQTAIKKARGEA